MFGNDYSQDEPVTWWRGYPIRAAMLLVVVHVATMLVTTIMMGTGAGGLFNALMFNSAAVLRGAFWQPFTYGFVNPPSLGFAIEMYFLWAFGSEVERFFGKRSFFHLYFSLLLLTPICLIVYGFFGPAVLIGAGSTHLAMFATFAMLYPGRPMLFNITAMWAAIIIIGIYTLQYFAGNLWAQLIALWVNIAGAYVWVKWGRGELTLPSIPSFKSKPKFRVMPDPERPPVRKSARTEDPEVDDIDPLLDKIARSGMESLTKAEKALLEKARAALLKKDPGSR